MSHSMICPLCKRELDDNIQIHHLKPVTYRTRTKEVYDKENQVVLHRVCHQKIHATFSEKELLDYFHTIERILESPEIQKFIGWVKNKPPEFYDKNDDTKHRKGKRKRKQ